MAEGLAEETVSLATSMNEDGPLPVLVHPHEASKTEEGINTIFSSLNHHLESEQTLKEVCLILKLHGVSITCNNVCIYHIYIVKQGVNAQ